MPPIPRTQAATRRRRQRSTSDRSEMSARIQHDFELTRPPRRHLFHQSSLMDNYVEDKMADWGMHHMIETFRGKFKY
ncbi:hypothetical protein LSAT2_011711 [Lamellibrachia satsuma]|nr:hypothetical protein LSAT2_011711 [Lamellibrachia satsuma]